MSLPPVARPAARSPRDPAAAPLGLALFFASSLACSRAESMREVAIWRLARGIGMSSGPVIALR